MTMNFQSRALLNIDMPSWAYIGNGVQLLVDGDMQAAGTAAWTLVAGTSITKEPSTLPGSTQCLRLTGIVNSYVRQTVGFSASGKTYRDYGWARGDGIAAVPALIDSSGAMVWRGTSSNVWQRVDVPWTAVGVLYWSLVGAGGYVEFDDFVIEWAPASTRNLGTLGGTVQLGDGYTAASFPTQVFPHGMTGSAAKYLLADNSSGVYNFTSGGVDQPFSIEVLMRPNATTGALLTKGAYAAAPGGWQFYTYTPPAELSMFMTDAAGHYFYGYVTGATPTAPIVQHVVVTYNGNGTIAGISMYTAGVARTVVGAASGAWGGLPSGVLPVYIGGDNVSFSRWTGSFFNVAIYPFVLQPGEVAQLYRQRLGLLNRGF